MFCEYFGIYCAANHGIFCSALEWLTNKERVGDVDAPNTLTTKHAVDMCKYCGEDKHDAPMFVEVCKNSSVQVTPGILKTLMTLLSAPVSKQIMERRDKQFKACNDKSTCDQRCREEKAAMTREAKKATAATKLDVTAMPLEWRVLPENRFSLTEKQFEASNVLQETRPSSTNVTMNSQIHQCPGPLFSGLKTL